MYKVGKVWLTAGVSLLFVSLLSAAPQLTVKADTASDAPQTTATTQNAQTASSTTPTATPAAATVAIQAKTITVGTDLAQVVMPVQVDGLTAPTWTAKDFDDTQVEADQAGTYRVKLSAQGLADLKAANPGVDVTTATVTSGTLTVQAAPAVATPAATPTTTSSAKAAAATNPKATTAKLSADTPDPQAATAAAGTPTTSNAYANVTTSTDTIGYGSGATTLVVNFSMNAVAGDTFTITIPAGGAVIDNAENAKVTTLTAAQGTTTRSTAKDGSLVVTNHFIAAGSYQQAITMALKSTYNGQASPAPDIGTTTQTGSYTKNDVQQGTFSLTQIVNPQAKPTAPTRVNPQTGDVAAVLPNQNYVYEFRVNENTGVDTQDRYYSALINSGVNYGTTITLPVPTGFTLNEALTKQINGFTDGTTITQPGGKGNAIIITAPKGAGLQSWQNPRGYLLVGAYDITQAAATSTLTASGAATVVQQHSDDPTDTVTYTANAAWTEQLLGANETGEAAAKVTVNGNSSSTPEQLVLDQDTSNDPANLGRFSFTYQAPAAAKDLTITATIPNGLAVNQVKVPTLQYSTKGYLPDTTSYAYTLTLQDGTTETGTVAAGGTITSSGVIRQLVLQPNTIEAGATVGDFTLMGHLAATYDDGAAVKVGDQLKTQVTVAQNGATIGSANFTQTVKEPFAFAGGQVRQDDKSAGAIGGIMQLAGSGDYPHTANTVFEPILYFVLPKDTSIENMATNLTTADDKQGLTTTPGHPTVTQFKADDGRTVVEFDYTGTGESVNTTTYGTGGYITLRNLADALAGTSDGEIYMTSPTTTIQPHMYLGKVTDLSLTAGDANAVLLDKQPWSITTVSSVYGAASAQGDEANPTDNASLASTSTKPLTFYVTLANTTGIANGPVGMAVNLPVTGQNGSTYTFNLTDPVTLPAGITGTVYYSTNQADLSKEQTKMDLTGYVTADQVTDWSAIRSVYIAVDTLAPNSSTGRLALVGATSLPVSEEIGTEGYLQTGFFAQSLAVMAQQQAASIKITRESNLTTRVHYVDANGQDQYIILPDLKQNLAEKTDRVFANLPTTAAALSAADQALLPQGYKFVDNKITLYAKDGKTKLATLADNPAVLMSAEAEDGYLQYELQPLSTQLTVQYVDTITGGIVKTDAIKGNVGDTGEYTVQVPAHYVLAAGETATRVYALTADGAATLTIKLSHEITHGSVTTTRTIHYVMGGTNQSKAPAATIQTVAWLTSTDQLTGETIATPQAGYAAAVSPIVTGYKPDTLAVAKQKLVAITQTPTNSDVTVTYTPNDAKLVVQYVDDVNGQEVKFTPYLGKVDEALTYTADFTGLTGYRLADGQAAQGTMTLTADEAQNIAVIHLTHELTYGRATTTRTITYHIAGDDQSKAPKAVTQIASWLTTTDQVTGVTVATPQNGYGAVVSPTVKGYTPNPTAIAQLGLAVTTDAPKNTEATVLYTPDPALLKVHYVDDVTGDEVKQQTLLGQTDGTITYQADLSGLKGYRLADGQAAGGVYQVLAPTGEVKVHLTHEVNDGTLQTTRTIQYVIAGTDQSKVPAPITQTVTWHTTTDEVTGETVATPQAGYPEVASPTVAGYTADTPAVAWQALRATTKRPGDSTVMVTYTPNDATLTLTYLDDVTGKEVLTGTVAGTTDAVVSYTADLTHLTGYRLADGQTAQGTVHLPAGGTTVVIHLTHQLAYGQTTTTRTITYQMAGGDPSKAPAPVVQTVLWHTTTDKVTGETVATPQSGYLTVTSPTVSGYTPDHAQVAQLGLGATTTPINATATVIYSPNPALLTINYVDDVTGQTVKTQSYPGSIDESISYAADLAGLTGYQLAEGQPAHCTYQFNAASGTVTIHLTHQVNHGATTTTRTIIYQMAGGDPSKAPAPVVQTVQWLTTTDGAAGHTVATPQSGYAAVVTPTLTGYTADLEQVAPLNLAPTSAPTATTVHVTYTPNAATLTVNYVDDVTGETVKTQAYAGVTDEPVTYQADLSGLTGYRLVDGQASQATAQLAAGPNAATVHLTHKLTYGTVTTTRTILYHMAGADQSKAPQAVIQTVTWKTVTDDITGETVATPQGGYAAVTSPMLAGYTADPKQVAQQGLAATTLVPANVTVLVTYTATPAAQADGTKPAVKGQTSSLKQPLVAGLTAKQAKALPKTGDADASVLTVSGLAVLGLLLGLRGWRKRENR